MHQDGGNAQEWQGKVGRHYDLPMVSFRDALWPEIKEGRLKWNDVESDVVHPNDRGHDYCARFITNLLARVLADLPADDRLPQIKAVPQPLPQPASKTRSLPRNRSRRTRVATGLPACETQCWS